MRFSSRNVHTQMEISKVADENGNILCGRLSSLPTIPIPGVSLHSFKYQNKGSIDDEKWATSRMVLF